MTTGSTILGLVDGIGKGVISSGTSIITMPTITYVEGNPDNVVTCQAGSDLAIDALNGEFYMGELIGGSEWIRLGSVPV